MTWKRFPRFWPFIGKFAESIGNFILCTGHESKTCVLIYFPCFPWNVKGCFMAQDNFLVWLKYAEFGIMSIPFTGDPGYWQKHISQFWRDKYPVSLLQRAIIGHNIIVPEVKYSITHLNLLMNVLSMFYIDFTRDTLKRAAFVCIHISIELRVTQGKHLQIELW